jgi:cell division protein FtsL
LYQGSKFIQRFFLLTDIFVTAVALLVVDYMRRHLAIGMPIESTTTFLNSFLFILVALIWTSTVHSLSMHDLRKLTSPRSELKGLGLTVAMPLSQEGRLWTLIVYGYANDHRLIQGAQ